VAIELAEQQQPQEAKRARYNERRTPASESVINPQNQKRGDRAANRGAAVEERHRPSALAFRKPFRNGFGRARPVGRFARAEQKAEEREAAQARAQRGKYRGASAKR